jgi:hypothetical protein
MGDGPFSLGGSLGGPYQIGPGHKKTAAEKAPRLILFYPLIWRVIRAGDAG